MEHHSHSPGVVELNSMQFWHRQDVALSGRSYGCVVCMFVRALVGSRIDVERNGKRKSGRA
jgi:hypothetical protein